MDKIKAILSKYSKDDSELFKDTIDELCSKGIAKGCYQDFSVVCDLLSILTACESIIDAGAIFAGGD